MSSTTPIAKLTIEPRPKSQLSPLWLDGIAVGAVVMVGAARYEVQTKGKIKEIDGISGQDLKVVWEQIKARLELGDVYIEEPPKPATRVQS